MSNGILPLSYLRYQRCRLELPFSKQHCIVHSDKTIYLFRRYFNHSCCLFETNILLILSNKDSYVKSIKVALPHSVSSDLYSGIA